MNNRNIRGVPNGSPQAPSQLPNAAQVDLSQCSPAQIDHILSYLSQATISSEQPAASDHPPAGSQLAVVAPPVTRYQSRRSTVPVASSSALSIPTASSSSHPVSLGQPSLGFPAALVAGSTAAPSLTQPFLGFNATQAPGTSQRVNVARRASAARTLGPASSSRGQRQTRSVASSSRSRQSQASAAPPGTQQEVAQQCLTNDGCLSILAHIYPPNIDEDASTLLPLFQFHYSSMFDMLNSIGLARRYECTFETSVVSLIEQIITDLRNSQFRYEFVQEPGQLQHRHEHLEVQLLGLHNKGTPSARDGHSYLRRHPISPEMTVANMANRSYVHQFCKPRLCIKGNSLAVYFVIARCPVSLCLPDAPPGSFPRPHTCVSEHFYNVLPRDNMNPGLVPEVHGVHCESCIVDSSAADEEVEEVLGPTPPTSPRLGMFMIDDSPPALSQFRPSRAEQNRLPRVASEETPDRLPSLYHSHRLRREGTQPSFFLSLVPPRLPWSVPFEPSLGPYSPARPCQSLAEFRNAVFGAACSGDEAPPDLQVQGTDTSHCAVVFEDMLGQAAAGHDFSEILSKDRSFRVVQALSDGHSITVSSGDGLERQTITILLAGFKQYLSSFFTARLGERSQVLACPPLRSFDQSRRQRLAILGAITGISLVNGLAVPGIDGAWLIYLLNGCEFAAITREVMEAFHPRLAAKIVELDNMGPTDDLTPLAHHLEVYAGIDVAHYANRDAESHAALAPILLYRALLGSDAVVSHADTRAFLSGFNLPCANGLTLSKAAQAFAGGPTALVIESYSTRITGYAMLQDSLDILVKHSVSLPVRLIPTADSGPMKLADVLRGFLKRTGIPCRASFERKRAAGLFESELVELGEIDSPSFRPRMLAIAATGSDSIVSSEPIQITFVGDNDSDYICPTNTRRYCLEQGIVSWQTCFNSGTIPTGYLAQLVRQTYGSVDESPFTEEEDVSLLPVTPITELSTAESATPVPSSPSSESITPTPSTVSLPPSVPSPTPISTAVPLPTVTLSRTAVLAALAPPPLPTGVLRTDASAPRECDASPPFERARSHLPTRVRFAAVPAALTPPSRARRTHAPTAVFRAHARTFRVADPPRTPSPSRPAFHGTAYGSARANGPQVAYRAVRNRTLGTGSRSAVLSSRPEVEPPRPLSDDEPDASARTVQRTRKSDVQVASMRARANAADGPRTAHSNSATCDCETVSQGASISRPAPTSARDIHREGTGREVGREEMASVSTLNPHPPASPLPSCYARSPSPIAPVHVERARSHPPSPARPLQRSPARSHPPLRERFAALPPALAPLSACLPPTHAIGYLNGVLHFYERICFRAATPLMPSPTIRLISPRVVPLPPSPAPSLVPPAPTMSVSVTTPRGDIPSITMETKLSEAPGTILAHGVTCLLQYLNDIDTQP
ncbi:uncharacterized protein C8Q71DRAFT_858866 [Rhodofomes roseus]|uniref:Uncharacterized protein n=1 Tax=Rhodofomes roseus TaxID=34475 RepID=A0ABQ8KC90_9APHY|nr:uncharacterized protein C8Q71DRAFT_858866 [Rhodofomes roseus]KAH9835215.1 hypothetical protein C8Q71DRAFT_858866 [Rhodofomes roseus]